MEPFGRTDYDRPGLEVADVDVDPLVQLDRWIADATAAEVAEPTAMTLSTVDAAGQPSSRNVLLRGRDSGLVFFTNYDSSKAGDLEANDRSALLFSWLDLHRQVRVEGRASMLSAEESDVYFATRPRGSQIGAWASPQSEVIVDRSVLDDAVVTLESRFAGTAVPRPPRWGGYRVTPVTVELWQGRPNRLHDRLRYRRDDQTAPWVIERLAP